MEPQKTSKSRLQTVLVIIALVVGVVVAAILPKEHFYTKAISVFIMAFIIVFIPNWFIKRNRKDNNSEQDPE